MTRAELTGALEDLGFAAHGPLCYISGDTEVWLDPNTPDSAPDERVILLVSGSLTGRTGTRAEALRWARMITSRTSGP
jgi:hypothetical protein